MRRLWRWLCSWFRKSEALELVNNGERLDIYRPVKRLIFSYFDGKDMVQADPMTLYRKLVTQGVDIKANLEAFHNAQIEVDAVNAHAELVNKVNQAFNLKPYEEGGVTSLETLACWDQFLKFVGFTNASAPKTLTKEEPPKEEPPAVQATAPQEPTPPTVPPNFVAMARQTESDHAPVVTIELDPQDAAVLTQGATDLPVLQREDNGAGRPDAPAQEADGHRAGA